MNDKYLVKVKNNLGKNKEIELLDGTKYILNNNDEKIIGTYSDDMKPQIFKLLKAGFIVSKILEENVSDDMKINTIAKDTETSSKMKNEQTNEITNINENLPKKRRGRPPKNKE